MIYKYKKNMTSCTFVGRRPYFKKKNIGKLIYRYFCDLLVYIKQIIIGVCESENYRIVQCSHYNNEWLIN